MRFRVLSWLILLLGISLIGGCQRINYSKTFKLSMGEVQAIDFSAPAYAQKVTVTITPTKGGVSSYLAKTTDTEALQNALNTASQEPAASLLLGSRVSKGDAETYSYEATVPARTAYTVWLRGAKKSTEVKVDVVGR